MKTVVLNESGKALYFTVKEKIASFIEEGKYEVGSQLPTESELCKLFDVSRTTIRLALQQLELDGKIYKVQGKGTFVSQPKISEPITQHIKSFSEQMNAAGLSSHSKVLDLGVVPATLFLSHKLGMEQDDPIIKLVRLRYADDVPYQHSTSYIPWKVAPNLLNDDFSGSLFELLKSKYDVHILKSVESIEPIIPEKSVCNLLNIPGNTPSFLSESLTYSTDNLPIEYSSTTVRGDYAKFIVERNYND
jgi:GntR family transcriptional regulator